MEDDKICGYQDLPVEAQRQLLTGDESDGDRGGGPGDLDLSSNDDWLLGGSSNE